QERFDDQRMANLAKKLAHKPAGALAFVHADLFDSETASVRHDSIVVISGNKILAAGGNGQVAIPEGGEVIDAGGKTLLPGLWDMHVHLAPNDGLLNIAAGVTSVRDLANDTDSLLEVRGKYDDGTEIGPRIVMAGIIDGRGPY